MQTARMIDSPRRNEYSPPPLEGFGREADGGWGEGLVGYSHRPTPPPNVRPLRGRSPQGEGENPAPRSATHRPLLAALLAGLALAAGGAAAAQTPDTTKRIFALPALQWNSTGVNWNYATQQSPGDLARVMGGLTFGLKPEEVSQRLPKLGADLHWNNLPAAKEFSEDVRYVRMPMQGAGTLRGPVTACFGEQSNVVLLFRNNGFFRASWRFLPGQACPSPHDAAAELYAAYVPLAVTLVASALYRAGSAEVVDVTDPGAGPLIAQRSPARGQ
jgi:hypothetical protein